MHPAIIIGTVRSLWTWLWDIDYVPQNVFLVSNIVRYCFSFGREVLANGRRLRFSYLGYFCTAYAHNRPYLYFWLGSPSGRSEDLKLYP